MLLLLLAAVTAAVVPPTPLQYYSQALATMQRLPEPAYVSFQTNVTARGMGIAEPCYQGKLRWTFGFGSQMHGQLAWHATYESQNASEVIRTAEGETCHGPADTFDRPTWLDAYAWVRYGVFSQAAKAAPVAQEGSVAHSALKTIADVSVIAPGAYSVQDGGAQRCPSGSQGHALHFVPRVDSAKHPLRDAVIETKSTRICMIRFDLGSYQAAGTGFRGDMQLDFDDIGGHWIISRGHAAMALRTIGISLKNVTFDFSYADVTFPTTAPNV